MPKINAAEKEWSPDVCFYHANCHDGFAAAWAVRRKWGHTIFVPAVYGKPIEGRENLKGKDILLVDFCFDATRLAELAATARTVVILDHHKSAQDDLKATGVQMFHGLTCSSVPEVFRTQPVGNVIASFDMTKSGARLAWEFTEPNQPTPRLIEYVEDRDLWLFNLKLTRAFHVLLKSTPMNFSAWDALIKEWEALPSLMETKAMAALKLYDKLVMNVVDKAETRDFLGFDGVPVVHCPFDFVSDACHLMLDADPDAPFAVAIVHVPGGVHYSLRSENHRQDVSEIAKAEGGGGHRNSAGFFRDTF